MKKFLTILAMSGALLAACSEDQTEDTSKEVTEKNAKADESSVENENNIDSSSEKTEIKEEDKNENSSDKQNITLEESLDILIETSKEEAILDDVTIEETSDKIVADFSFNENTDDASKQAFILKYEILAKGQYPDKKIETNIKE